MKLDEVVKDAWAAAGLPAPDAETIEHVIWGETGYPSFWSTTPELPTPGDVFKAQVRAAAERRAKR